MKYSCAAATASLQVGATHPLTPMPLEIQILHNISSHDSGAFTVKLSGSLDTATAPELEREIAPVLGLSLIHI